MQTNITELLDRWSACDERPGTSLIPLVYGELRRQFYGLAAKMMRDILVDHLRRRAIEGGHHAQHVGQAGCVRHSAENVHPGGNEPLFDLQQLLRQPKHDLIALFGGERRIHA